MTIVIRPSRWHKNFGPNGLSASTLGLCLNFFSSITADFNISSALRWAIQDQWSSVFLAHLSRRLTKWAYSIPMVRRPSVVRPSSSVFVRRRRPHFQTWISLKPVGQSWSNFMCSITGVGKRLHKVLGQNGSKLWFPWQQKAPLTYNGENDVSTFSWLFLIWSFLYLQVTRTCIKSRTSSNFGQIGPLTKELAALECLNNFPYSDNGKMLSPC